MKNIFSLGLMLVLQISLSLSKGDDFAIELEDLFVKRNLIRDEKTKSFNDNLSTDRVIYDMGFGWNLGNTLDAFSGSEQNQGLDSETCWGNPATTRDMIRALVKKEIKTLRIPITWHNHLIDDRYTIDPQWMRRVKEIVDWAIDLGMYVIIDSAHDNAAVTEDLKKEIKYGTGYYPSIKDAEESERFLYNIWRQIAIAFNNGYDHHLIFETLSAPNLSGTLFEWNFDRKNVDCVDAALVLNEYNNLIFKVIRETGGNNAKRFILFAPYAADVTALYGSDFAFPDDSKYNPRADRLLLSLHYFTPSVFTKENDMDLVEFKDNYKLKIDEEFLALYETYVKKGFHVVFTEIGIINKNNLEERIKYVEYIIRSARKYHIATIVWDNGKFANPDAEDKAKDAADAFGQFHRKELKWDKEGLINTLVKRSEIPFSVEEEAFQITLREYFNKNNIELDERKSVKFDDKVTAKQVSEEVGFGWNLGNTFDSHTSPDGGIELNIGLKGETLWGNPETTEEMIETLAKKGIHTIRIPVSWHNHLADENYTIDKEWMKRVKTVVDWALKYGLYVIINSHHDNHFFFDKPLQYGQGYYPNYRNIVESERFIFNIWRQIALAFNNGYDHHLIFEGLNEPRLAGYQYEWNYEKGDRASEEAVLVLNEYMRLIVKAIRETGGNNEKRFIMITPYAAQYTSAMNTRFSLPDDSQYNPDNKKLIVSVHMYTPYPFALGYDWNNNYFGSAGKKELYDDFKSLYFKYIVNGIQIIIGEMGALNKKNMFDRIQWAKYYTSTARRFHMSSIVWDNNFFKDSEDIPGENLGEFHRDTLKWDFNDMINAYLKGSETPFVENPN